MRLLKTASSVVIDNNDMKHTHLWVVVDDADGNTIELIEQYPLDNRVGAYAMSRRLAKLLDLPLSPREEPFGEARTITDADIETNA